MLRLFKNTGFTKCFENAILFIQYFSGLQTNIVTQEPRDVCGLIPHLHHIFFLDTRKQLDHNNVHIGLKLPDGSDISRLVPRTTDAAAKASLLAVISV